MRSGATRPNRRVAVLLSRERKVREFCSLHNTMRCDRFLRSLRRLHRQPWQRETSTSREASAAAGRSRLGEENPLSQRMSSGGRVLSSLFFHGSRIGTIGSEKSNASSFVLSWRPVRCLSMNIPASSAVRRLSCWCEVVSSRSARTARVRSLRSC